MKRYGLPTKSGVSFLKEPPNEALLPPRRRAGQSLAVGRHLLMLRVGVCMKPFIALFRGINVGGNNLLPMKDLKKILESLGCSEVTTYIQSGNALFRHPAKTSADLSREIAMAIEKRCGFRPELLILRPHELSKIVDANPFSEADLNPSSLHVTFLASKPEKPELKLLDSIKRDSERFLLRGKAFYLHAPDGIGRSKLAARTERALGVAGTSRNMRTISKIMEIAKSYE